MSMQDVVAFGRALSTDEALQAELEQALGGVSGEDAYAPTARFAQAKGFDVTPDEVGRGVEAMRKAASGRSGELGDAELEIVSGGKTSAKDVGAELDRWGKSISNPDSWKAAGDGNAWKKFFGL